ncbi:phosphotransferase family protein [Algihabitans albus]|uniref:phosphotransferase family protein n=1 Tax=Algihabitans albus TaxID=2164067 RepID=UPI000E5DA13A|nr:phosphotransferase family protein [Algihabitans albus]
MTAEAAAQPDFDLAALTGFLKGRLSGLGELRGLERLTGGQSNPTYRLKGSAGQAVLRKQPSGDILPSAHAMDREFRVLSALAETQVPVPRVWLFCDDPAVIGTPFYVMEYVEGRVFHDCALPELGAGERAAIYDSMNEVMARLHQVDWEAADLSGFGRVGGYFTRQMRRWSRQLELSSTRVVPELERVRDWLTDHLPDDTETTLCHGDLRLGNLLFAPDAPRAVVLLDWELSTLGNPLADVAFNCIAYHSTPEEYGGLLGLDLGALGIPAEAEYLDLYYERSGRNDRVSAFHLAFSLFRFAVIFEGIAARAKAGTAAAENAEQVGALGVAFARRADRIIAERA